MHWVLNISFLRMTLSHPPLSPFRTFKGHTMTSHRAAQESSLLPGVSPRLGGCDLVSLLFCCYMCGTSPSSSLVLSLVT